MSSRRTFLALSLILCCATAVMAAEPMKALIVDGQNNHNWKETTPVLKRLLEETKAFPSSSRAMVPETWIRSPTLMARQ